MSAGKLSSVILVLVMLLFSEVVSGQSWFWIGFSDKAGTPYSIDRPQDFLSTRSIERRARQQIPVDETDLPINPWYADSIISLGATRLYDSRWFNGIVVRADHDSLPAIWESYRFVREVEQIRPYAPTPKRAINKFGHEAGSAGIDTSLYGLSAHQVGQLNGHFFHQQGFQGEGMLIAVLDAGFNKANLMPALSHLYTGGKIAGTRDFVSPGSDMYSQHEHGTMVLSAMAGYLPGFLVGTAPGASYILVRTEDVSGEYRIEEYNWLAGAEYADSLGADIINSSLGYSEFDDSSMNYTYADMDGRTTRVTRGANLAAAKGMLVFSSAGNEARTNWKRIVAPADGEDVIAVGAVDKYGTYAGFSSLGPASDGAVKPDLAAMGLGTAVHATSGAVVARNGTSFASPVLAGIAACLWQANPDIPVRELARVMRISGHQSPKPDSLLGYGIPDMHLAHILLNPYRSIRHDESHGWQVYPNPFSSEFTLVSLAGIRGNVDLEVFTITGTLAGRISLYLDDYMRISDWVNLTPGVYLLRISGQNFSVVHKMVKAG